MRICSARSYILYSIKCSESEEDLSGLDKGYLLQINFHKILRLARYYHWIIKFYAGFRCILSSICYIYFDNAVLYMPWRAAMTVIGPFSNGIERIALRLVFLDSLHGTSNWFIIEHLREYEIEHFFHRCVLLGYIHTLVGVSLVTTNVSIYARICWTKY